MSHKAETTIDDDSSIVEKILARSPPTKRSKDLKIKSLKFWCTACTHSFEIFKKNNKGELIEQQICPHMIYKSAVIE